MTIAARENLRHAEIRCRLDRWLISSCFCQPGAKKKAIARILALRQQPSHLLNLRALGLCCLPRKTFKFISCVHIDASFNLISSIFKSVFEGCMAHEINLSANRIVNLEHAAFAACDALQRLVLDENQLRTSSVMNWLPKQSRSEVIVELRDNFFILPLRSALTTSLRVSLSKGWQRMLIPWLALCDLHSVPIALRDVQRDLANRGYICHQACDVYRCMLQKFLQMKGRALRGDTIAFLRSVSQDIGFSSMLARVRSCGDEEQIEEMKRRMKVRIAALQEGQFFLAQSLLRHGQSGHAIVYKIVRSRSFFQLFIYDTSGAVIAYQDGVKNFSLPIIFSDLSLEQITCDECLNHIVQIVNLPDESPLVKVGVIDYFRRLFNMAECIEFAFAQQFSKQVMGTCAISSWLAALQASFSSKLFFVFKSFLIQEALDECMLYMKFAQGKERGALKYEVLRSVEALLRQQLRIEREQMQMRNPLRSAIAPIAYEEDVLRAIYAYYVQEKRACEQEELFELAEQFRLMAKIYPFSAPLSVVSSGQSAPD